MNSTETLIDNAGDRTRVIEDDNGLIDGSKTGGITHEVP